MITLKSQLTAIKEKEEIFISIEEEFYYLEIGEFIDKGYESDKWQVTDIWSDESKRIYIEVELIEGMGA